MCSLMPGKPLIIAEKPSAARAIAAALGGFKSRQGYLESAQYLLAWALGHLVELQDPEEYDPRLKRWSLQTLPIMPESFRLKVLPKTQAQFRLLEQLAAQAPELINACDAAREGELIFRYIAALLPRSVPTRRLWISSLTAEAIRHGFANLRPAAEFDRLYASARCRSQGDWLVGINLTRAYTARQAELLSVGRVQTPTLALLVRREREIAAFVPETYWEVFADFTVASGKSRTKTFTGKWFTTDTDRLGSAEAAQAIIAAVAGRAGRVARVEVKPVAERPPQLHDLTALQREANRRYGFTAAATLAAAQALYEAKLITYPRTDSRYITRDLVRTLPNVLACAGQQPAYAALVAGADAALVHPGNRRVVDDSKVGDHHAILPTDELPGGLGAREAKVYDLVVRRFLAQFYPEARYLETEVATVVAVAPGAVGPELRAPAALLAPGVGGDAVAFRSRGRQTVAQGWHAVEQEPERKPARRAQPAEVQAEEATAPLPALAEGDGTLVRLARALEKQTQPPRRYSEAMLLGAMETAGRQFDDEALREAMKGRGLGTPATRAAIIERLKQVGYVQLQGKTLVPTPKGEQLVALAERLGAEVLLSPELTGEWEKRIADIQAGTYEAERFMAEIRELTAQLVEQVRRAPDTARAGTAAADQEAAPTAEAAVAGTARRGRRRGAGAPDAGAAAGGAPGGAAATSPGLCPQCRQPVWRAGRGYTCGTAGCGLDIPAYLCGKVLDPAVVAVLLGQGRTPLIEGFKSRAGKPFSAYLTLQAGKVGFEFPARRQGQGTQRRASAGRSGGARQTGGKRRSTAARNSARTDSTRRRGGTGASRTRRPEETE